MRRLLPVALVALLAAAPALAAESSLEREFPSGSIRTREQAAVAISAARTRAEAVEQEFKVTDERCGKEFAVTRCRNDARSRRDRDIREVDRVLREGREVTRRLEAQERTARRAEDEARRAASAPAAAKRAEDSRRAFEERQRKAAERMVPPPRRAALPDAAGEREPPRAPPVRKTSVPPSLSRQPTAEERAENVRRLQEKQRAAQEYARVKAAERAENERRRAARRQERLDEERAAAVPEK